MLKFRQLGVLFFLIPLFLFLLPAIGQNKKVFVITGKIVPEVSTSENGAIELSKNGEAPTKIEISKNGRFRLELEYFNEFTVTFILKGHFSKTILVSTDIPQEVWKRDNDFPPYPIIVQLFKEIEGIDKSFTLKPSGKVFYGKQTDNFENESFFNDTQIAEQITTALKQTEQVKKEAGTISKQEEQDLAAKQKNFDQAINEADVLFKRGEFPSALLKYQEARTLFPEKVYANDRMAEIQDLMKALKITEEHKAELEQKYKSTIALANEFFDQKTYNDARPRYEEALQFKPGDGYAIGRIKEIDQLLALLEKQKQFDGLIAQADNKYKSKKSDQAITLYNQAKLLIPENEYPQNQINLINQEQLQLVKQEQQELEFTQAIENGDKLVKQKDFIQAINSYRKALELKPDNKLATDKITISEQAIAAIDVDKKYQESIRQADLAMATNDLQKAKMYYQEAFTLKSREVYPVTKLAEIKLTETNETKFIELVANAEKEVANQNYNESVNLLNQALQIKPKDPSVQKRISEVEVLKNQQVADKEFDQSIQKGDQQKEQGNNDLAINFYRDALKIRPKSELALGKILEVEQLLAALGKQKQYLAIIAQADMSFDKKEYVTAKADYRKSMTVKPDETYPATRIKEIDQILGKEQQAKALDDNYKSIVSRADKLFESESYADARKIYTEALTIKPNDAYPTGRISNIDEILAQKANEIEIETEFLAFVSKGDAALNQKDYESANSDYSSALAMKPNSAEVKTKIKNIESILQKLAAANTKKEEDRLLALASATQKEYTETIARGNKQIEQKAYSDARITFEEAKKLKPTENLPDKMIAKIDSLIADNERGLAQEQRKEDASLISIKRAQQNSFKDEMAKADKAFTDNNFNAAEAGYRNALSMKVTDPAIVEMIGRTETKLAAQDSMTKSYNIAINAANKLLEDKQYKEAKDKYLESLLYLPESEYPKHQIEKLDELLAQAEAERLIDESFASKVKKAETLFSNMEYQGSRSAFVQASEIKPSEPMPIQRIKDIDKLMADLVLEEAKNKSTDSAYTESIKRADLSFAGKEYTSARSIYGEALAVKPNEEYPKNRIAQIDVLLNELITAKETDRLYAESIKSAQEAFSQNKIQEARDNYQKAHDYKPAEPMPPMRIAELDAILARLEETASLAAMKDSTLKSIDEAFNRLLSAAKDFEQSIQYISAILKYKEAIEVKPAERKNVEIMIASLQEKIRLAELSEEAMTGTDSNQVETPIASEARTENHQSTGIYDEIIGKADDSFGIKDYSVARFYYYKASDIKPKEGYPRNQIELIRKLVDSQLSSLDRSGYQQAITQADDAFQKENYTVSKFYYYKALGIKSWEKYPKDRIQEILALTNSLLSEREEKEYRDLIASADEAFTVKDISIARFYYNKAISMKKDEDYPKIKIKDIQKLIEQDGQDAQNTEYNKLIELGDQALQSEIYNIARFNYNQALNLKPNENYPKDQLKLIRETLDK